MRETKDSRISWLGEYPANWELKKIKYCLQERIEKNNPIRTTEILSLTAKTGRYSVRAERGRWKQTEGRCQCI